MRYYPLFQALAPVLLSLEVAVAQPAPSTAGSDKTEIPRGAFPAPPFGDGTLSEEQWEQIRRKGIDRCNARLQRDPNDVKTLKDRAEFLFLVGESERALADATSVVRLRPQDPQAYLDRALLLRCGGRFKEAVDDVTKAIELGPRLARAYQRRAELWELCGDFAKAAEDYTCLLQIENDRWLRASTLIDRGGAYFRLRKLDNALNDYCAAIDSIDDAPGGMYARRADVYRTLGDYDKAEKDCTDAIAREPDEPAHYCLRGSVRQESGRYAEALADFRRVDELNPKRYQGYQHCAWIWAACPDARYRNARQAIEAATKLCQLTEWSEPWGLVLLAAAYAEAGDFARAVAWLQKSLNMNLGDDAFQRAARPMLRLFEAGKPFRFAAGKLNGGSGLGKGEKSN